MDKEVGKVPYKRPQPKGGNRRGKPNKFTADVKAMVLESLDRAGGIDYLVGQSVTNASAYMALIGRVLPLTVAGDPTAPLSVTWVK